MTLDTLEPRVTFPLDEDEQARVLEAAQDRSSSVRWLLLNRVSRIVEEERAAEQIQDD